MSITGTATGKPATEASFVVRASPRQRETSVEVPPISKVMMSRKPAAAQTRRAPTTPPAGPERMARTGSAAAVAADTDPPFDCMTRIGVVSGQWAVVSAWRSGDVRFRVNFVAIFLLTTDQ